MSIISLQELQQNAVALLKRVEAGERIVVSRDGYPIAELRPLTPTSLTPRPSGLAVGQFVVPNDFDAPLPEDLLRSFEGQ